MVGPGSSEIAHRLGARCCTPDVTEALVRVSDTQSKIIYYGVLAGFFFLRIWKRDKRLAANPWKAIRVLGFTCGSTIVQFTGRLVELDTKLHSPALT